MTLSDEDIAEQKNNLRKDLLAERRKLSEKALEHLSGKIYNKLIQLSAYQNAEIVHSYIPIEKNKEVDTWNLVHRAYDDGKRVVVPVMDMNSPNLYHYEIEPGVTPFQKNKVGIPEPVVENRFEGEQYDLIIVPMVGGDYDCNRLGYGRGYYDRFLGTQKNAIAIGLMPEFCLMSSIPLEDHDIPLHAIITERSFCKRSSFID